MSAAATIPPIRPTHGGKFIPHKMLTTGTTMARLAEYPDLINKIAFFQIFFFETKCKYTMSPDQIRSDDFISHLADLSSRNDTNNN